MDQHCEIPRWQMLKQQLQNLGPVSFRRGIETKENLVLLDVRTKDELDLQKLDDAIHVDYLDYNFLDKLDSLDRELVYYVYCRTGRRSVRTCVLMQNWGFTKVFNLEGGLVAWNEKFGELSR